MDTPTTSGWTRRPSDGCTVKRSRKLLTNGPNSAAKRCPEAVDWIDQVMPLQPPPKPTSYEMVGRPTYRARGSRPHTRGRKLPVGRVPNKRLFLTITPVHDPVKTMTITSEQDASKIMTITSEQDASKIMTITPVQDAAKIMTITPVQEETVTGNLAEDASPRMMDGESLTNTENVSKETLTMAKTVVSKSPCVSTTGCVIKETSAETCNVNEDMCTPATDLSDSMVEENCFLSNNSQKYAISIDVINRCKNTCTRRKMNMVLQSTEIDRVKKTLSFSIEHSNKVSGDRFFGSVMIDSELQTPAAAKNSISSHNNGRPRRKERQHSVRKRLMFDSPNIPDTAITTTTTITPTNRPSKKPNSDFTFMGSNDPLMTSPFGPPCPVPCEIGTCMDCLSSIVMTDNNPPLFPESRSSSQRQGTARGNNYRKQLFKKPLYTIYADPAPGSSVPGQPVPVYSQATDTSLRHVQPSNTKHNRRPKSKQLVDPVLKYLLRSDSLFCQLPDRNRVWHYKIC